MNLEPQSTHQSQPTQGNWKDIPLTPGRPPSLRPAIGTLDITVLDEVTRLLENTFADNPEIPISKGRIQNLLNIYQTEGQQLGSPNFSIGLWKGEALKGCLLAGERHSPEEAKEFTTSDSIIHIGFLASAQESSWAAVHLLRRFAVVYRDYAKLRGEPLPIAADVRVVDPVNSTSSDPDKRGTLKGSYNFINKNIEKIGRLLGEEFEIIKGEIDIVGNDTFHEVVLVPKSRLKV